MYMPKGTIFDLKHIKSTHYFPKKKPDPKPQTENLSLANHHIPDIKDWLIRNGEITLEKKPLVDENGSYFVKSKEFTIMESLLPGVNTGGKVTIQIEYVVRKFSE